MKDIAIITPDGCRLPASLFEKADGAPGGGPLVLISSATAVPRRFYRHFAQYLADSGARAVMTYDYRGMDGGLTWRQAHALRMSDWATVDLPSALSELTGLFPGHPVVGLGHSFGGQALGLSGAAAGFLRYMTMAAGSGYLGHIRDPLRYRILMNLVGLPVAAVLGHLPSWAGLGEPLPFGAFNQWRRWCNSPDYFMNDPHLPQTAGFSDVRIPMMAVGFWDDPLATRASVEALVAWYAHADIRLRWFSREDSPIPVGHFGFFRRDHREVLWPPVADWLVRK